MKSHFIIILFFLTLLPSCKDPEKSLLKGNDILSFSFSEIVGEATIDATNQLVSAVVDSLSNLSKLTPEIQSRYSGVEIICMTSPMADHNLKNAQMNYLTGVINHLNNDRVHKLFLTHNRVNGCDYHPSRIEQEAIAAEIISSIKTNFGW